MKIQGENKMLHYLKNVISNMPTGILLQKETQFGLRPTLTLNGDISISHLQT